jgi:CRP-like cAMP-binding protein
MDAQIARKIEQFFSVYPLKRFDKNQILVYAGDEPPGVFHLERGQVRQYDITGSGEEVVVNVFQPPAFFPMSWAINHTPNRYFFETATPIHVRIAPADAAVQFLRDNADVTFDLLRRLYSGADGMQRRMAHLMGGSAASRVIFELVIECKRFGDKMSDGTYALRVHEDELARRAGLSRETVNRELGKLKTSGLLRVSHKDLIVTDLNRLEAELGEGL